MTNSAKIIEIQVSLKDIPSKYWDKIEVNNDWDKEYQVDNKKELPMMINYHHASNAWDKRFKSDEMLANFKKFTNGEDEFYIGRCSWGKPKIKELKTYNGDANDNKNWYFVEEPRKLTRYLRNANKLFIKNGHGKLTSQEAFEFLQSIIESKEIKATFKLTKEEFTKFFELDKEIILIKEKFQEQIDKLKGEIEDLASELLEIKKSELNQLISETKSKLDEKLHDYLEILLASPDKNLISEKAKRNLIGQINNNDLQKLLLLQHKVNHLEERINNVQQAQIEILPPSYNQ